MFLPGMEDMAYDPLNTDKPVLMSSREDGDREMGDYL